MKLTEEEIKELKEQAKVKTHLTNTIEIDVCNYETAQSLFDKLTEVIQDNKELTLESFMLTADTYWSGDDCYGNLSCSYEVPLTQDEMFDILKRNLTKIFW